MANKKELEIQKGRDRDFLRIESSRLQECLSYWKSNSRLGLSVSRMHGYEADDLDFLKECKEVESVYVQDPVPDTSALVSLSELRWLTVSKLAQDLDLAKFPHLETLRADCSSKLKGLEGAKSLRHLALWSFAPKELSLKSCSCLQGLESLELVQARVEDLSGCEDLGKLTRLEVSYAPALRSVSALNALSKKLEVLRLDHCKNVEDLSTLAGINSLKELGLNYLGEVDSIGFIARLSELEHLSIVQTNVLDGDLSPCLRLKKLRHLGSMNKRHYSPSVADVKKAIEGNEAA